MRIYPHLNYYNFLIYEYVGFAFLPDKCLKLTKF